MVWKATTPASATRTKLTIDSIVPQTGNQTEDSRIRGLPATATEATGMAQLLDKGSIATGKMAMAMAMATDLLAEGLATTDSTVATLGTEIKSTQ